ncbi:2-phosphosulfolactate phosphatase [Bacillus sp. B-jedd]|uniref:2-phosphosulfolactate phosphatase n=1 Tax=Bacillus sp. B-jedd TaxID=1476857 RepID=UPI0005155ADC|nr:2-phosphosulfolactate phosphatase [Bacillus sp. B-jedd]CEG28917.1 2-phosphosulfolactate phosphatase [Bacillus sp. B-jedd]
MKITIHQGHTPDLERSDVTIVIDVIRAFTVAHYAFLRGAREIFLAATVEEAFLLQKKHPGYLLAGEINGLPIHGFEFDNSPAKMAKANVRGRTLVKKTTNGVRATLHALNAGAVFVTGFSNAKMTAECIRKLYSHDSIVNLVASHPDGDDDLACAEYIKEILLGKEALSKEAAVKRIKGSGVARKFYDENQPEFNVEDIEFCTKEISGDFIMFVDSSEKIPRIVRVNQHELHRIEPAGSNRQA